MTTPKRSVGLCDAVSDLIRPVPPGPKHWTLKMPSEARDQMLELRRKFQAGEYGRASAAAVAAQARQYCLDHGWPIVAVKELSLWLNR